MPGVCHRHCGKLTLKRSLCRNGVVELLASVGFVLFTLHERPPCHFNGVFPVLNFVVFTDCCREPIDEYLLFALSPEIPRFEGDLEGSKGALIETQHVVVAAPTQGVNVFVRVRRFSVFFLMVLRYRFLNSRDQLFLGAVQPHFPLAQFPSKLIFAHIEHLVQVIISPPPNGHLVLFFP